MCYTVSPYDGKHVVLLKFILQLVSQNYNFSLRFLVSPRITFNPASNRAGLKKNVTKSSSDKSEGYVGITCTVY